MKHKLQKAKILKFIESVDFLFDLNNYTKEIEYKKIDKEEHGWDVLAQVTTDTTYRKIYLEIFPAFFTKDKEEQCKTLIHELSHSITEDLFDCYNNMYKWSFVTTEEARHAREKTTEQVAYLLFELGSGRKKYFSEAIAEYLK